MTYKIKSLLIFLITLAVLPAAAENRITATNSWTKAFVAAAGSDADQIASADMKHPPEYELKPSDVIKINKSDLLVFAGYEVMMKTVFDSFNIPEDKLVKIKTSYAPAVLEESVMKIASKTGTEDEASVNIAEYKKVFRSAVNKLKDNGLYGKPVIVQFHLKPLINALGFKIIGVIGPGPLEVSQIAEMGKLKPELIIDNAHNPAAGPVSEITGVKTVELINFPGYLNDDGTRCPDSLTGVLIYNSNRLFNE